MKTKVRTDRLRKLADHLMNKLPSNHRFSFGTLYEEQREPDGYCGTVACAVGELPFCFPDEWIIDIRGVAYQTPMPYLKKLSNESVFDDTGDFFNLDGEQVAHLFIPRSQMNGNQLYPDATAQQVGLHILYFCAMEEGEVEV